MCRIEGCDAKPVAKGLCAKHYMRQRRQGSPDKVGKPGRPCSPLLECLREEQREWERKRVSGPVTSRTLTRRARRYRLEHARLSDEAIMGRIERPLTGRERRKLQAILKESRASKKPRRRS
jgi:hypothetical protein